MVANRISDLTDCRSEPNMMGIGPIITTPPPFTLWSLLADMNIMANTARMIPTRINANPRLEVRSTIYDHFNAATGLILSEHKI